MTKPNPYCAKCRGKGKYPAPYYGDFTPRICDVECECVHEQREFNHLLLDLFGVIVILSFLKWLFS